MSLLLLSVLSSSAHADPLMLSGLCGPLHPCRGLLDSDGVIEPPWFEFTMKELRGDLNFYRVEVRSEGDIFVLVGGYPLDERSLSSEGGAVYYVPAVEGAEIEVYSRTERDISYSIAITGAAKAPF